ncbi:MAG TPA: aminotransferase class V-fold PLP-dependent enzyme [Bryobacteraceae bacterium]|nr:aminotransferase class V-fold PLP-dependent enzyme [Bryobacteraceae bacterium]
MPGRRAFLQRIASAPFIGALLPGAAVARKTKGRDLFAELGVRTFINAAGTYTALTASLMPPEVADAWQYGTQHYVALTELQDKVGERIASMLGVESAMVTSGAAGALTIGTAACLTGSDPAAIKSLPDLTGLKSEVIIQKKHRFGYDHAVRATGVKLIEAETAEDLERAVNPKTAMMLFLNAADPVGQIKLADFIALGKKHGIPTFLDAAADVPPVGNLSKYSKMGFDLVTFSGGKGLRGPQSSGLLLGRKDLIAAARLNTSPFGDTIARGMKVNKEEMLGMLVALELYLKKDHDAEWKEWQRRVRVIADAVRGLPSVQTETFVPEIANQAPHLKIWWDQSTIPLAPPEAMKQLREGRPSIEACPLTNPKQLVFGVWMMQPGDAEVVAKQVRAVLKTAQKA